MLCSLCTGVSEEKRYNLSDGYSSCAYQIDMQHRLIALCSGFVWVIAHLVLFITTLYESPMGAREQYR